MDDSKRPARPWSERRVRELLDQTQWLALEADLPELGPGERRAIGHLIDAGAIVGALYEAQRHREALAARRRLLARHEALGRPDRTRDLLRLYRLFDGPIATTLDNRLEPFLPVAPWTPGGAMYPDGVEGDAIRAVADAHPERRASLLGACTIIREATPANLRRDRRTLRRYPVLAGTHPGFADELDRRIARLSGGSSNDAGDRLYAPGYSVVWPEQTLALAGHLRLAADAVADEDPDLSAFLRLRSLGLLADDVEVGDPAWIRGTFRNLEVVIGPWEVYDDGVLGVRASYGLALLVGHEASTQEIRHWVRHVAEIDAALPYDGARRRPDPPPMASYDALAVFGAARNVLAETLPNDPDVSRRYGRRILLRRNFGLNAAAFRNQQTRYAAVVTHELAPELTVKASFIQTVAHELAHYVGPDAQADGRRFADALGEDADIIEELKAEVMSFSIAAFLEGAGEIGPDLRRGVLATLIHAGLRNNAPLRSQTYPVARTMIVNRLLSDGVLTRSGDRFGIDHERALVAIQPFVAEILALQVRGTRADVTAYIDRWSAWNEANRRIASLVERAPVTRFSYEWGPLEPQPVGLEGDASLGRTGF
jgi:hypothetical protein